MVSRAVRGVLAAHLWPAALAGQAASSELESTLRGELVRFADASVQVSVFATAPADLPEALWTRVRRAGAAAYLPEGSTSVNDEVRTRLEQAVGLGGIRTVSEASGLEPFGVHVGRGGEVRLVWYDLTEDEGVAILGDARAADEAFTLRILIPNPNVTEDDWWGLQAALSRVGIRRVQIFGGGEP